MQSFLTQPVKENLLERYNEPHRVYHNQQHLYDCFVKFDKIKDKLEFPEEVEAAIWFHDAVYTPVSGKNEEKSVQLMHTMLYNECGVSYRVRKHIDHLIMATKHKNDYTPFLLDEMFFLDIDMSILGESEEVYNKYSAGIRLEYGFIPIAIYQEKRSEVLRGFLGRENIYYTVPFRDLYQAQAEKNILRELRSYDAV